MSLHSFNFTGEVFLWEGTNPWHFVSLPIDLSQKINQDYQYLKAGWGSLAVVVSLKDIEWSTSIFLNAKTKEYLLPLKADIRKKAQLKVGDILDFKITIKYAL